MLTVICHFFNEEEYLPVWLGHHRQLFDHGIMIDYGSTDSSPDIVRALVPEWELLPSQNTFFESRAIDQEVMAIERGMRGWKMALNVTEFLITADLSAHVIAYEQDNPSGQGFVTRGCLILESPDQKDRHDRIHDAIWEQYHFGCVQTSQCGLHPIPVQRARLIHKADDGRYGPGRHSNDVSMTDVPLYLFWYGWCPLRLKKSRNSVVRPRIPTENLAVGWGTHHVLDDGQIETTWASYVPFCCDLTSGAYPELNAAMDELRESRS